MIEGFSSERKEGLCTIAQGMLENVSKSSIS